MTCSFAVRGAIKKLPGVESVDVSLNKGLATIKLKPGNTMKPEDFWETVRKNGFTPKETAVVVKGKIERGKLMVAGTSQVFDLTPQPAAPASGTVTIRGTLTPPRGSKASVPLQVRSIEKER